MEVVGRSVDCVYAWVVDMAVVEVFQAVAVEDPTGLAGYNSDLQRLQQANNLLVRLHHHWKKKPKQRECHRGVAGVSQGCRMSVTRVSQGCHKGCHRGEVTEISQRCRRSVTGVSHECHKGCRRGVTGVSKGCHRGVTEVVQGCRRG